MARSHSMAGFHALLRNTPKGLYCPPGDFHIDPVRPATRAVITHGHSDHARSGHGTVLATPETLAIMRVRYGEDFAGATETAAYGQQIMRNGVDVTLVPAGHVMGSAQVVLRWKDMTIVVSGDYKRRHDPTCPPFEPVPCHLFATEATFGLPVFRFPPAENEVSKLLKSVALFPERTHLVGAYALGKAQRIIRLLREAGYARTLYMHGAMASMNALYETHGVALGALAPAVGEARNSLPGEIVIAPPSAIADKWARRFADPLPTFASGWMAVRARARQRHVELPLVVSDHADWDELTLTIGELKPEEVWITHGSEEALLRWSALNGVAAQALEMAGYDDEET
ncbi:MAG TPA: ligase-associated DNA damage response exonuclease [Rhizomicrobium sp.]